MATAQEIAAVSGNTEASAPTSSGSSESSSKVGVNDTSSGFVSSMEDLKKKAPKVYKMMLLSIAQNMCVQMNRENDRLIEELRKIRHEG